MKANDVKLSMWVKHEKELKTIKEWIDATHEELNILSDTVEKMLELIKDNSKGVLEHEHRLLRLEGVLNER